MTISFRSHDAANNNAASITVTKPSGVVDGDMLIAFCGQNAVGGDPFSVSGGGTWTKLEETSFGLISGALFYKAAGASEPASYDITASATSNFVGQILAFSTDGTFDTPTSSINTANTNTTITTTSVSPATGDAVTLGFVEDSSAGPTTPPSGPTLTETLTWSSFQATGYQETGLASGSYSKSCTWAADEEIIAFVALLTETGGASVAPLAGRHLQNMMSN